MDTTDVHAWNDSLVLSTHNDESGFKSNLFTECMSSDLH